MKIINEDQKVHVLNNGFSVRSVVESIVENEQQENAFYVCDIGDIVRKDRIWKKAMPRVKPYYAVKVNNSPIVIETLAALGTNFDCASLEEVKNVVDLGIDPNRIIFANPAKPPSHLRFAKECGVDTMTFDNVSELHKTREIYPNARMVLRIRCDDPDADWCLGMKFGCDHVTEAPELLRTAKDLGVNVIGVSFHVGSGCSNPPIFRTAIGYAKELFDYAKTLGYNFTLLDIGGGYPGVDMELIDRIAESINSSLDDYFPDPSVRIIAEPGRYYVATAYTLACKIHSVRSVQVKDKLSGELKPHNMYFINDGIYGSFNGIFLEQNWTPPKVLKKKGAQIEKLISSSVWGPTCDPLDKVGTNTLLPELDVGDWLLFDDVGAYTICIFSRFNGFSIPKTHLVASESVWLQLKDNPPFSPDQFFIGNTFENLRLGLDIP